MRRTNHRLFRNREGLFISLAAVGGLIAQVQAVTSPATSPHSAVPFATLRMVLDGRVTEKEWRDAAVVRNICVFGTAQPANPATTFYLKHDGAALLVGVRCLEYGAGYPKAHPRKSTDQLSDDDAIQVVLGTAEECLIAREVLNMGGYAGAMKQPAASADHYYQFTVNAVGARARTYNESVLERPLFQAQASRLKDEWDVEMRIPFASAGILKAVDRTLLANFFRFRPPDMAGWHLPGFGGYVPMPFGTTTLLPRGQEEERTVEVKRVTPKPSAAPAGSEIPMEIQWYPLSRCVVGSLSCRGPAEGSKAVLRVVGFGEKQARLSSFRQSRVIYDLPTTAALPAKAELELRSKDGRLIRRVTRTLEQVPQPPWHGTKVGEAYLKDRIPSPWTRPEMRGRRVRLHDKTLTFGSSGLFESVRDDLGELLAGPAEILLVARGRQILLRTDSLQVSVEGTAVRVEARQTFPGGAVETRAMVDYDGFTVVKLRVRGVGPKLIQKLSLRIPLCKENAKFVHRELVQEIRELTGFGWEGPAGPVWLGGHDKGLSFNSDTDLFLSRKRRSQVQVIEEPDRTWLQMNLVDGAGQVTEPDHIFRFFLQPTPTKRLSLRKQQSFYDFAWEQWSDYQGYPDLAKTGILSKSAEAAHAKGRLFGIYTCQLLAENTPGFSTYRTDLLASPPRSMYQRAYDPGEGVPCYLCCKRGPEGDLLLDGLARLIREAGIDGIYSDGTSMAWECDNPSHRGCGRPEPIQWKGDEITRVVGQRRFLKRLRGIFDERGKPFYLAAHCGGGLDINTLSFFDGFLEGEQLARFRPGYRLPLSTMAVGYCGHPWGFRTVFWDVFYSQVGALREGATSWAMTYALPHDVELNARPAEERRLFDGFEDEREVTFYPYWRPQPHLKRLSGNVLCSYWRKSQEAMVVVSNLTWNDQRTLLDLSRLFPNRVLRVAEVLTDAALPQSQGRVDLTVKSHQFLAMRVSPLESPPPVVVAAPSAAEVPAAPFHVAGLAAEQWGFNAGDPGVTVENDWDLGTGRRCFRLKSTIWQAEARAQFKAHLLGRDWTARLRIQRSGRMRFRFGRTGFFFDSAWKPASVDLWNEGRLYQPDVSPERTQILILSLHGCMLDAVYGGQPLARNLKLAGLTEANAFELATWGGDWFAFDVLEISSEPTRLYAPSVRHPVL